ncbi:MAG: hypothetical protein AAB364_03135 [Patescibacteria group bacterium]
MKPIMAFVLAVIVVFGGVIWVLFSGDAFLVERQKKRTAAFYASLPKETREAKDEIRAELPKSKRGDFIVYGKEVGDKRDSVEPDDIVCVTKINGGRVFLRSCGGHEFSRHVDVMYVYVSEVVSSSDQVRWASLAHKYLTDFREGDN